MESYGQFCAVARALELLGERWTLLVARELLMGSTTFGQIQSGLPRIPPATLTKRLRSLEAAALLTREHDGSYRLTPEGDALRPVLRSLASWAMGPGAVPVREEHLDTAALTWDLQRRVSVDALPDHKVTVAIDFIDRPANDRRHLLQADRGTISLCSIDLGDPIDVHLAARTDHVVDWWLGVVSWAELLKQPTTTLTGDRTLIKALPSWFLGYALASRSVA